MFNKLLGLYLLTITLENIVENIMKYGRLAKQKKPICFKFIYSFILMYPFLSQINNGLSVVWKEWHSVANKCRFKLKNLLNDKIKMPWKILTTFNISQRARLTPIFLTTFDNFFYTNIYLFTDLGQTLHVYVFGHGA